MNVFVKKNYSIYFELKVSNDLFLLNAKIYDKTINFLEIETFRTTNI